MEKFNANKTKQGIMVITLLSIILMFIVDYFIQPGYIMKSMIKIILFLIIPLIFIKANRSISIKEYFRISSKKQFLISLGLGIGVYLIILGAYFILRSFINLDNIQDILLESLNVDKDNFIFVALYISFFNSLLEEFFFRGFIFLSLLKTSGRFNAYVISALAFAIYHVAIMADWFNLSLFILAMSGLFIGALIFNYLNEKNNNIYNSWLVHMFANFAINTVGFIMFGII
ncbi:MAG: type II CAAX endopeptidase family protein [Tissierellaceae bacterium]|nr:type II CAAX endopeptidase family protein [Tissierellaceae bacterium]